MQMKIVLRLSNLIKNHIYGVFIKFTKKTITNDQSPPSINLYYGQGESPFKDFHAVCLYLHENIYNRFVLPFIEYPINI
jgi:hypothetical protein